MSSHRHARPLRPLPCQHGRRITAEQREDNSRGSRKQPVKSRLRIGVNRLQGRGGSGILTMNVTGKTGSLMAAKVVTDDVEEIVAMSKKSQVIRVALSEIPTLSRATQGVRVMKLREGDSLASLICL